MDVPKLEELFTKVFNIYRKLSQFALFLGKIPIHNSLCGIEISGRIGGKTTRLLHKQYCWIVEFDQSNHFLI